MQAKRASWLLLGLCLAWVGAWLSFTWPYWEDDAFIHLAYASNVAQGLGFMFNGQTSNGDTSPLWVLLLAAGLKSGAPTMLAGKLLTVVCAACSLAAVWRYTHRMADDLGMGRESTSAWPLALLVASPYFCYWAFSGMESVAAVGWLLLTAMALTPRSPSPRTLLAATACLGLGPLLRPELMLMFIAGAPFLLAQGLAISSQGSARQRGWVRAFALIGLVLPLVLWSAYALQTFGHVMPNTNAAKQAPPGTWVSARLLQVMVLGFPGLFLLLGGAALAVFSPSRHGASTPGAAKVEARCWMGLPFTVLPVLSWALLTALFYVLNHTHVQTRYVLVMVPGLLVWLWLLAERGLRPTRALGLGLASVLLAAVASVALTVPHMRNKMELIDSTNRMAAYIEAQVPRDAPIAIYAIGQFGYLLQHHELVDVGGITRPSASKFLYDEKARVAWARTEGARYFIWGEAPEPDAVLVQEFDARTVGWHMNPAVYAAAAPLRLWRLP